MSSGRPVTKQLSHGSSPLTLAALDPLPLPLASGRISRAVNFCFSGFHDAVKTTGIPSRGTMPAGMALLPTNASPIPLSSVMKPKPLSANQTFMTPVIGSGPLACPWLPLPALAGPPKPMAAPCVAPAHTFAMGLPFCGSKPASKTTGAPTISASPSTRLLRWTKTSALPSAGVMNPMPLASIQALTTPCCPLGIDGAPQPPFPDIVGAIAAPLTALAMGLALLSSQPASNMTWAPTERQFPSSKLLRCTNTSGPPSAGEMNPMPRSSSQAFTVPGCPFVSGGPDPTLLGAPPVNVVTVVAPEHFAAMGLLLESSQPGSKTTSEPITKALPSRRLLRCTKTSGLPSAGAMKPIPRSSIQAFTVPGRPPGRLAIVETRCRFRF
mmetsp:Transcript_119134/g.282682  ORF Transcript_119134/g.282682 Transcript_119134/m.282682 type:complete len:382 (+) Transcript_119134:834-1979(+)